MAERPMSCAELRALAPELALGSLEGDERGAALAHLDRCPACRAEVDDLAVVVDQLLSAAPEAEPPPGFEAAVSRRLADEQARDGSATVVPLHRARNRALALAAAVVLLVAGVGIGLAVDDTSGPPGRGSTQLARAPMITPAGDSIGEAWRTDGDEALVFVSVPGWAEPSPEVAARGPFTLELDLADGGTARQGAFTADVGGTTWVGVTDLAGADIAAVSLVDADGRLWCTGRFA
ncbi:MAG: hypothetical protein KDB10_09570 [Acidimicrobiales bacterium]|nr:hypothetical protein [Acidimicrobiales bacterium]